MSRFEFNYDGSTLNYPATLLTALQDICKKAGVELGSASFLNSDIQVSTYDNTVTAREYLSYISECAGGFAFIGRDGKLYIRTIYQNEQEIPLELFGEYKWGDKYKISKVSYENGVESFKFGNDTENNLWLNQENIYIVDEEEVKNIYNQIKDLETYSFEGKTIIDPALDVGDKIIIDNKPVIYQGEKDFQTRFIAEISSKIAIKQKQETTTKTTSQKVINRRVQSRIDEAEGKITQLVEETSETTEKLTKVEQTVDGITQTVQDIENVTQTAEESKTVTLEDCVEGDLLELHIYGNNAVFDYLYPGDDLYPSDNLYPYGDSRIIVTDEEGNAETYELGVTDVLRQNGDTCDEYVLQDGKAKVIRRINKDGTVKAQETIEELGEYAIHIKEGINILTIKNYTAKINTKYAIKNDYTEIFATKVEMNSSIKQTAEEINLEVSKKVGQDEFGTLISQNAYNVKIAWNNNTKCVQFEDNGITLYDGEVSENAKRAIFDFDGNKFYRDGYFVGAIRTNRWKQNNEHKSLEFDLSKDGKYMAWAAQDDTGENLYTKLTYTRANSIYTEEGLHIACNTYGHWFTLNDFHIGEISAGGYTGYSGSIPIINSIIDNGDGTISWDYSNLEVRNGIVVGFWI